MSTNELGYVFLVAFVITSVIGIYGRYKTAPKGPYRRVDFGRSRNDAIQSMLVIIVAFMCLLISVFLFTK